MPPKAKITKEMILQTVLDITRETGFETVNARSIAGKLKCSTRPIFTCYANMEEMKKDFDDVEEIILEFDGYEDFSRNNILNMLVEALVLNDIFLTRRPKYRRIRDNYVFVNGIYSGIRRR